MGGRALVPRRSYGSPLRSTTAIKTLLRAFVLQDSSWAGRILLALGLFWPTAATVTLSTQHTSNSSLYRRTLSLAACHRALLPDRSRVCGLRRDSSVDAVLGTSSPEFLVVLGLDEKYARCGKGLDSRTQSNSAQPCQVRNVQIRPSAQ